MLQHQHMQLEARLMEGISQHSKYFLLDLYEVWPEELITKRRLLSNSEENVRPGATQPQRAKTRETNTKPESSSASQAKD